MKALALFSMTWLTALALAQSVPEQTNQAPVIHVDTTEVSLDLVVHDKKARPVMDLKPEEIVVTDDGSPIALKGLHLVTGGSGNGHLITLVFDRLEPDTMKGARSIAGQIFKMIPQQRFSFAVLHVDGRLRLHQTFTSDRAALQQAVMAATQLGKAVAGSEIAPQEKELYTVVRTGLDSSGRVVDAKDRVLSRTLLAALQDSGDMVRDENTLPSLASLWALVKSQQQITQRKVVIYFTHCRQMDSRSQHTLESIVGAANRTGESIYIVDLNGLDHGTHEEVIENISNIGGSYIVGTVQGATSMQSLPNPNEVFTEDSRTVRNSEERSREKTPMQALAENTGGGYIAGEDNLRKPLEQMIQDMTTYYEVSYVPAVQEYDGKFRPIAIKPLRAGLSIRSSTGYYALPPNAGIGVRPFELPLLKILNEPQLPNELAFHARVLRLGDLPNLDGNALAIEIPLSELEIREDTATNLYSAHITMLAQIKDKTGKVIDSFSQDIPRRGALRQIDKVRGETVLLERHFVAAPGEYVLEAAVLDSNSGKAGAQRTAFEIPQSSIGPSLSDLVMVRRMEPFDVKSDPLEPLLHGPDKITPNISDLTTREAKGLSVFFVTHPDPNASDAAAFSIQMFRNGEALASKPVTPRPIVGTAAATHLAAFPVSSLPDGEYEIKATITQGGKSAESFAIFRLSGGAAEEDVVEADGNNAAGLAIESRATGPLPITFTANQVRPPAPEELKSILTDATEHATRYSASLPNFVCVEVTNRSVDPKGQGRWEHRDKFVEMLTYRDKTEKRTMLEFNGLKTKTVREDLKGWMSNGEFGGMLNLIFGPSSKADFHWKETGSLEGGTVQVFDYSVARENSTFSVGISNVQRVNLGFHGQVFVDSSTRNIRRVTMVADEFGKFPVHATSISMDYDYIAINDHDYLLPVGGEVRLRPGRREIVRNQIEFRDFRRFSSTARIITEPIDTAVEENH